MQVKMNPKELISFTDPTENNKEVGRRCKLYLFVQVRQMATRWCKELSGEQHTAAGMEEQKKLGVFFCFFWFFFRWGFF